MCGIVGVVANADVQQDIYTALLVLQHRGQDAAGIATDDHGKLSLRKGRGLVRDVFTADDMASLAGTMGVGHVRYPTAGSCAVAEAQPFYVNSPYGICLGHNGNLTNTDDLCRELFESDMRHINTSSDTEVLLNVFAHELQRVGQRHLNPDNVFAAAAGLFRRVRGAFACVGMILGHGIVGFRDPNGIRPLVIGHRRNSLLADEYVLASESVALDALGFTRLRDVEPGECVYITRDGRMHARVVAPGAAHTPCIFEHVYLARPDSVLDDISVYKARLRMGERLADRLLAEWGEDHGIDVVIPIPDTSRTAALSLANRLNLKYREGYIKNRYIGRTFIMPGQAERKQSVRRKLNAIGLEFLDKHVLLVDDSIVRGTTCHEIIQMAREAGAKQVSFASAAPPVRFPNVYGIDMPASEELIAHGKTVEDIRRAIGADRLLYQDLADLVACTREGNPDIQRFECSCFDGHYVTEDVDDAYLHRLAHRRNDTAKQLAEAGSTPNGHAHLTRPADAPA
ncbi:MAG: amidophosphoribosyltransferase [Planctomycetota bacterium]